MDQIENIIEFLKNIESENKNLKNKVIELELSNKNLNDDLNNLSKFSLISNFDKQLKEKNNIIISLEQQINKNNNELKEKNGIIYNLENELEKINCLYKEIEKLKSDDEDNEKYQITFKKVNYLVDNDNNVYNMDNIIVGKLVNKKVKFF